LNYENESNNYVYFDDLKVNYKKSQVVQSNNYYAFGLQTSQSWTRIDTKPNQYLYNSGSELNKVTENYEMFFRGYDPAIGRMSGVDMLASSFSGLTPYQYGANNPIRMNDPTGAMTDDTPWAVERKRRGKYQYFDSFADYAFQNQNTFGGGFQSNQNFYGKMGLANFSSYVSTFQLINNAFNATPEGGVSLSSYDNGQLTSRVTAGGIKITFIPGELRGGSGGRDIVGMEFKGLLINNSDTKYSEKQLVNLANRIENQLMDSFSGISGNLEWLMSAELNSELEGIDHLDPYRVIMVNDVRDYMKVRKDGSVGFTQPGWNKAYMNATGHNLTRTASHEVGHSMGLNHVMEATYFDSSRTENNMHFYSKDDWRGNLMHQSATVNSLGESMAGTRIEAWQIINIMRFNRIKGR